MPYFISHAIFYVKVKEGVQKSFPIWENVYLICAESDAEALRMAEEVAKEVEAANKEMFLDGRPALFIFRGIMKVNPITDLGRLVADLQHGQEITYSQFEAESEEDVTRLATGKDVRIIHIE